MSIIQPEVDVDIESLLKEVPKEDTYYDFYMEEYDIKIIISALMGREPRNDAEREARRILLNGMIWQITGEQEIKA